MEDHIAGDPDRHGIAERRELADREPGDLGDDLVHRQASPELPPGAAGRPHFL